MVSGTLQGAVGDEETNVLWKVLDFSVPKVQHYSDPRLPFIEKLPPDQYLIFIYDSGAAEGSLFVKNFA